MRNISWISIFTGNILKKKADRNHCVSETRLFNLFTQLYNTIKIVNLLLIIATVTFSLYKYKLCKFFDGKDQIRIKIGRFVSKSRRCYIKKKKCYKRKENNT